jgi:hypothetical protein
MAGSGLTACGQAWRGAAQRARHGNERGGARDRAASLSFRVTP